MHAQEHVLSVNTLTKNCLNCQSILCFNWKKFDLGKSVEDVTQLLTSEEVCIIKAIKAFHGCSMERTFHTDTLYPD